MKTCLYCAEEIENADVECPYCRMDVTQPVHTGAAGGPEFHRPPKSGSYVWIFFLAVFGGLALLIIPCMIAPALMLPVVQQARGVPRRIPCRNNLAQIGLALHNYHETYGSFPPAYVADENGTPMHSWRVLILPFLDSQDLYDRYDFSEPWDSPVNELVLESMPTLFRCPSDADVFSTSTNYAAAFGEGCIFEGSDPVRFRDVTDGTSNTILVGEISGVEVPWTKPQDVDVSLHNTIGDPGGFSSDHPAGCNFLLADGSVQFIPESIDPQTLDNMFQRNDGNVIGNVIDEF